MKSFVCLSRGFFDDWRKFMEAEKKPSDESVAAVEKWSETPEVDAALAAYEESPLIKTGWRNLRDAIAGLLDAERDAVLDDVQRTIGASLGLSPEAKTAAKREVEGVRRRE
jgi:hypothetical protein